MLTKPAQQRANSLFLWVFYIFGLCVLIYFYFMRNAHYSVDDSFITYRYALNLKDGNGLVFNVGERYYGTTAAGYAILLAGVTGVLQWMCHLLGVPVPVNLDVPQVSVFVSAVALATIGAMLVVLVKPARDVMKWLVCYCAAVVLFVSYPFNEVAGHETYAFLSAVLVATVLLFKKNRPILAAVVFALASSFRPDAVMSVGAALLVNWYISKQSLKSYLLKPETLRLVVTYTVLMTLWFCSMAIYFGSPIPGTLAAKKVQVGLGYWPLYNVPVVSAYLLKSFGVLGAAFVGLGLVFLICGKISSRGKSKAGAANATLAACSSVALFGALSFLGYLLLSVTFWQWYGVPVVFCLMFAGAAGWILALELSAGLFDQTRNKSKPIAWLIRIAPIFMLLLLAAPTLKSSVAWAHSVNINNHIHAYDELANFIKTERPDGAVIQTNEPGSLAYHLGPKYKVVDELGLISPGVAQALKRKDMTFLVDSAKPDYLICSWKGSYTICDTDVMSSRFKLVGSFDQSFWKPYLGDGVRLFRAEKNPEANVIVSARQVDPDVSNEISDVQLGDKWGVFKKTEVDGEYFVHPGAKSDTAFTINCRAACTDLKIYSHIADLPKDAPANVARVGIKVIASNGEIVMARTVVDRQHPLALTAIHSKDRSLRVVVDNNGDPTFDWTIVGLQN